MVDVSIYAIAIAIVVLIFAIGFRNEVHSMLKELCLKYNLWQFERYHDFRPSLPPTRADKIRTTRKINELLRLIAEMNEARQEPEILLTPTWFTDIIDCSQLKIEKRLEAAIFYARKLECFPKDENVRHIMPSLGQIAITRDSSEISS